MKPWDGIISEEEQKAYHAAGFGRSSTASWLRRGA